MLPAGSVCAHTCNLLKPTCCRTISSLHHCPNTRKVTRLHSVSADAPRTLCPPPHPYMNTCVAQRQHGVWQPPNWSVQCHVCYGLLPTLSGIGVQGCLSKHAVHPASLLACLPPNSICLLAGLSCLVKGQYRPIAPLHPCSLCSAHVLTGPP